MPGAACQVPANQGHSDACCRSGDMVAGWPLQRGKEALAEIRVDEKLTCEEDIKSSRGRPDVVRPGLASRPHPRGAVSTWDLERPLSFSCYSFSSSLKSGNGMPSLAGSLHGILQDQLFHQCSNFPSILELSIVRLSPVVKGDSYTEISAISEATSHKFLVWGAWVARSVERPTQVRTSGP
ncbi:uncharacterized protein LOC144313392 [Canis aureus]